MDYRSEVDGLRAFAVIPVTLFHAHVPGFSGGYIGVDIFFVISGYLITSILITDIENKRFSLANFYERRLRRILPALAFVVLLSYPIAYLLLLPSEFLGYSQSIIAVTVFVSNVLFFLESDYFATASELKPLLHTWSLAIEEQYYVFFPIFLAVFWKFGKAIILVTLSIVFGLSLLLAIWASNHYPSANFYLLPSRVWELLVGAGVAFLIYYKGHFKNRLVNQIGAYIGLIAILYSISFFSSTTPFPSAYALIPTLGTACLIVFATNTTHIQWLLSTKPLVYIGLISYSLYLWHQPVFAFFKQYRFFETPSTTAMLSLCLVVAGLAHLSWKYVETPFRSKQRFNRHNIFLLSLIISSVMIALGLVGLVTSTHKSTPSFLSKYHIYDFTFDNTALREESWGPLRLLANNKRYQVDNNDFDQSLWFDKSDIREKLLIVGNSHSKDIYNVLSFSKTVSEKFQLARYGQQISEIELKFFDLPNYQAADVIVFASQYRNDSLDIAWLIERIHEDGKRVIIVKNIIEMEQYYARSLTLADKTMREAILSEEFDPDQISDMVNEQFANAVSEKPLHQHIKRSNDKITALKERFPNIIVLDRMHYICGLKLTDCIVMDKQLNKYFYDYGHHTLKGAQFFGSRVDGINWLKIKSEQ